MQVDAKKHQHQSHDLRALRGQKHEEKTGSVKIFTHFLRLESSRAPEFIDITDQVCALVEETGVTNGFANIYSIHTTAAIKINENEPLLLQDMEQFLERIAARNGDYKHNDFTIRTVNMTEDECPNGHAHCQHLLMGASETVPLIGGRLQFGRWQRIFLVELDRPKQREVIIQVFGV